MSNYKLPRWLQVAGVAYVFWTVFLLALEPGNVMRARSLGYALAVDREALRIGIAALLGCSAAPWILALNRRHPLSGFRDRRGIAIHALGLATLSLMLILVSCLLAAWLLMAKPLPTLAEIRGQLAANWLLLTFALSAFALLCRAAGWTATASTAPSPPNGSIPVRSGSRRSSIELADVEWIEAQGNYLALHVAGRSHLVRETLQAFARRPGAARFVRIHRSVMVAIEEIRAIQPIANGDSTVILRDGQALRASRSYRAALRRRWAQGAPTSPDA